MPEKAPSPRRAAYLRTVRREKRRVRIWQIALVVGLFAVWELSCRLGLSDGFLVSSPSRMVQTLWRLCASGELWHHAAVSIGETVLGFTAGTVLGTAVAVAMWWSETAARILIAVEDHGCGIPEREHKRIFERFYRVDKARSRKLGGTGLGLSIVKHIAFAHNGNVRLESAPGTGSTFIIELPRG